MTEDTTHDDAQSNSRDHKTTTTPHDNDRAASIDQANIVEASTLATTTNSPRLNSVTTPRDLATSMTERRLKTLTDRTNQTRRR